MRGQKAVFATVAALDMSTICNKDQKLGYRGNRNTEEILYLSTLSQGPVCGGECQRQVCKVPLVVSHEHEVAVQLRVKGHQIIHV